MHVVREHDVEGLRHVAEGVLRCTGGVRATLDANNAADVALYEKCASLRDQGRKACQAGGCTYTPPPSVKVAFGYANLVENGVAATAPDPAVTKWRLCMVSVMSAAPSAPADTRV